MIKIGNSASRISVYTYQPNTRDELEEIILDRISKEGPNCNMNDIDTSLITDMGWLFYGSNFNGDISNWNVSNVENMSCMFCGSKFNKDISNWDVSNVKNMEGMFSCSYFDCDISRWRINENCYSIHMFYGCPIKEEYKPKV